MLPSISTDTPPANAAMHFRLCFLSAVRHVIDRLAQNLGSIEEVLEQFPFLREYLDELENVCDVHEWERGVDIHLPVRALRVFWIPK